MSRFIEQLQEERARLAPMAKNRKKHESDFEKYKQACNECFNKGLRAGDERFEEMRGKRGQAERLLQEAQTAEKRLAEIDRIINAKADFADEKLVVEAAYESHRAAKAMKRKTEELASQLAGECRQLESDIQAALDEHGKKQVEAMLADGTTLPVPARIRELKDSLAARQAALQAAKNAQEAAIIQADKAEATAHQSYNDYMAKRLALAELNYMLALEQVIPEFAEYAAVKAIAKNGSVMPDQFIQIDLGPEAVRMAREMIIGELRDVTGRDGH